METKSVSSCCSEDAPICWICLDISGELIYPCKCPRAAHRRCLARWQLQSAGTRKEKHCEFCDCQLPDWKEALTPQGGQPVTAPAIMNVNFDGKTYSFEVKPGPDGYMMFTEAIRRAFDLPEDSELNITFTCDEPTVPELGSLLTLQGPGAYDAAVHCASVSAARRLANSREHGEHPHGIPRATSMPGMQDMSGSSSGGPSTPTSGTGPGLLRHVSLPPNMPGSNSHLSPDNEDALPPSSVDIQDGRTVGQTSPSSAKRRLVVGLSKRVKSLFDMLGPRI